MEKSEFLVPVGYHEFNKNQLFNYQLNRWYSFGYTRFEDMEEAGQRINNFEEWKTEMLRLAENALSYDRLINAAFYYRAAEFSCYMMILIKKFYMISSLAFFTKHFEMMKLKDIKCPMMKLSCRQ